MQLKIKGGKTVNSEKLEMLRNIYDNITTTLIIITDDKYEILYDNDNFAKTNNITNIRKYLNFYPENEIKKNVIMPVTIHENNYSANIVPIYEQQLIEGYMIRLITAKEIQSHQLNRDLILNDLDFFASMREQISGIINISTYLHDSLEKAEMYEELKYLNLQANYCYKLLSLTFQKTEIAKYSYGVFDKKKINLKSFLGDISFIIKTILRSCNAEINFECPDDAIIVCDSDRLVNIILCLIVNSIQYNISENKSITISVTKNEFSVLISIKDNGLGMKTHTIQSLFSQSDKSDNFDNESNHIGLGYFIVKYFCNAFNCSTILSSKENYGTTITLKFPSGENASFPFYLETKTSEYLTNRFSNIYIALSQITDISFF